eukprot:1140158-Pelagomonas_calceolata.AAC.2
MRSVAVVCTTEAVKNVGPVLWGEALDMNSRIDLTRQTDSLLPYNQGGYPSLACPAKPEGQAGRH